MQSTVWFTDLSARPGNSLLDKTGALLRAAGIRERIGPVALDQACVDLVIRAAGRDPFRETHPSVDWSVLLDCGEEIGLGTRSYRLETL